ncbi:actin-like ATPase domain-containing protein [Lepidopterella palustris CBS 459.81]|uniref:Actin-like ATPase domain-containing protein n=1 Tax=Lepidopterella palustris CBS 459.81 TaxID=1314670 RepID=A0A8E2JH16_9PEZI|nr:actin-like ATPase domain-containing protein [Lepidopterella palustris CBS 459.81]
MAAQANRLVIGLDYGTTFTGVAFRDVLMNQNNVNVDDGLRLVDVWPPRVTSVKVPSEISFSAAPGRESQWGFDISQKATKMVWTKLELDQQERSDELRMILSALNGMKNLDLSAIEKSHGIPDYPAMDPEDIVADYLSKVRAHVVQTLVQTYGAEYLSIIPIDIVITVPAVWSDQAKDRTFRAINKAKFDNTYFKRLREIVMVTEPEAAALYTLRSLKLEDEDEPINPGDCFVLCDAGGGTVDLISYQVKQMTPALKLEEVAIGTGDKCGATMIDRNFRKWLEARLGTEDFEKISGKSPEHEVGSHTIVEPNMQRIMSAFDFIKLKFGLPGNSTEEFLPLPPPLNDLNDPSRGIEDGEIRITNDDLLEMFRPCVDRTIELIAGQLAQVQRTAGSKARYVFLSGGFGGSEHLFNKVKNFLRPRGIPLKRPKNPWSAVVRGAVIKGLEQGAQDLVYMRKCRRSYGISVSEPFSEYKHAKDDEYIDPFDNKKKAKDQMTWLIKKGDALLSNKSKHASIDICRSFGVKDSRVFRTILVACDENDPPQRYDEVPLATRAIAHIDYDLTDIPENKFTHFRAASNGKPYFQAYLKLELQLKDTLKFRMVFDGEEMNAVTIQYQ